jgi:hypothetical protein
MIHRSVLRAAAAVITCAAAIACSAAHDESTQGSNEALVLKTPPPGDDSVDPPPPATFTDKCGVSHAIATVPAAMQGLGCSDGFYVDGQPVWLCRESAESSMPSSLGTLYLHTDFGVCHRPWRIVGTCEGMISLTHLTSACFDDAPDGYTYMADIIYDWRYYDPDPDGGNGSCGGGCAYPRPPFAY